MEKTLKTILLLFLHHKDNILNPFFKKSIIFEVFFHFHILFLYIIKKCMELELQLKNMFYELHLM